MNPDAVEGVHSNPTGTMAAWPARRERCYHAEDEIYLFLTCCTHNKCCSQMYVYIMFVVYIDR